ncbi:MAG: recombinase family protein, partial [Thermoleophilia bacterium]
MTRAATAPHHEPLSVAVYERVSSDEQRDKETIQTQTFLVDRHLSDNPELKVYHRYLDDGVSGSIPLAQRPQGRRLVKDAMDGRFTKVLVTRADRLGRDARDLLNAFGLLESLGIELVGIQESLDDYLTFGVKAVVSDHEKRRFLERSAEGIERIVRAGFFPGGIVPLGYKLDGQQPHQRAVPSDILMWRDMTEADLVRWIYDRLALDRWSCPRIAKELNAMGVPTAYAKDRRYVRGKRTEETWRPGRIANLVHNSVYRGVYVHNKRSRKLEPILVECERLVSDEIWYAAQETLASNFIMAKNTTRRYFLRSLVKCGQCGRTYTGGWHKTGVRYRCCGALTRLQEEERCLGKEIKGSLLEEPVWADLEHFLRNPGGIVHDLLQEMEDASQVDPRVERRAQLQSALAARQVEKQRLLRAYLKEV